MLIASIIIIFISIIAPCLYLIFSAFAQGFLSMHKGQYKNVKRIIFISSSLLFAVGIILLIISLI